ncbi:Dps family protein [Thalassotalea sp. 1_MG-2023]|uniref:Dps family protein n=1 Tax=Thalassotalea sp. 1_MG-2023 TaxID=3062680 RepID=UPI0026E2A098|nr:Dps family protein [Thalassotalea sp. 1_MG-2023]MDO6425564.1 Dps family protein [Thalassotalea sp. 1_MG-2023]
MSIDIGIAHQARQQVANQLNSLLADTYTLYLQSHNFHWNVTGPLFRELHLMFEEHYVELAEAVDEIAERIRTLGFPAPGTYQAFASLTSLKEPKETPDAHGMLETLLENHETLVKTCRSALKEAQQADDESSLALISDRMRVHEKTAWMLRAMTQK